ncbi:MAG: murein hydrolase activator EnvC, partial [Thermomicrobiales bacterium]
FACENTGFNSGWWHTGENWYTSEGNSAGALVYAVASGQVRYADADYPGRVVIVEHEDRQFSMYGHLDYDLAVATGEFVTRGTVIGTVLSRTDTRSPSHLHFEIRDFLFHPAVNGDTPRYAFACGPNCAPGPGYWPMSDGDLPADLGWLNPTHVIGRSAFGFADIGTAPAGAHGRTLPIWSAPGDQEGAVQIAELSLAPGDAVSVLDRSAGRANTRATSADGYRLWVKVGFNESESGWVAAVEASDETTGIDGRPSAIRFNLLPVTSS